MVLTNMPVQQLTQRPFSNTSRMTESEQGNSYANPFFDARNIGNGQNGEIVPTGTFMTRYPTNVASNSAGFSITDDAGNDRRLYPGKPIYAENALSEDKAIYGSGTGGSSGSSSDYLYSNPYFASLLNPKTRTEQQATSSPLFSNVKYTKAQNVSLVGSGTNAPAAGDSWAGYSMNNPYAFQSNFSGGALGAAAAGSSSDYYQSDPFRVPDIQKDSLPLQYPMLEGGAIDYETLLMMAKKLGSHVGAAGTALAGTAKEFIAPAIDLATKAAPYVAPVISAAKSAAPYVLPTLQSAEAIHSLYRAAKDSGKRPITDTALRTALALASLSNVKSQIEGKKQRTAGKKQAAADAKRLATLEDADARRERTASRARATRSASSLARSALAETAARSRETTGQGKVSAAEKKKQKMLERGRMLLAQMRK